ncbi:hypothetical protein ACQ4PT_070079 [Festuca glaucescens]
MERGGASPYSGAGVPDLSAGGGVISSAVKDSRPPVEARAASALDDDIWDIRFNLPSEDNLERNVSQSDITVLNLLAMIECYGYGIRDTMYFVKEKGKGLAGMEVIDNMAKKGKQIVPLSDDEDAFFNPCQYKPKEHNRKVAEELELMRELKRQKLANEHDPEVAEIMEKMNQQKRQIDDPYMHYEGDTYVEEVCEYEEEDNDGDEASEPDYFEKKQPMRSGPTSRCHHEVVEYQSGDFIPSTDEESSLDDFGDSDDDGFVKKLTLASGKKRKLKKMKKRNWHSECSSTSAPTTPTGSAPAAAPRATPAAPTASAPAAAPRAPPTAPTASAPAAAPTASAPAAAPRAPPARAPRAAVPQGPRPFSAPRSTEASGTTRVGRQRKMTPRMQGYLNAGKHDAYKK